MKIYVSSIIEKDNKFLLIREAKEHCYGKWNFPSGHVEENEYIIDAAIREVKEETNLDIKLAGLISIYNNVFNGSFSISFIFATEIENNNKLKFNKNEILEIKWFSFEDIKKMKKELRDQDYIIDSIEKYNNKNLKPLNTIIVR